MSDFVERTPPWGIYAPGAHGRVNRWLVRTEHSPATLLATSDWQAFEPAVLPPSNWFGVIDPIVFAADDDGWMMASGDKGFAVSTDGALGLEWSPSPLTNLYPGAAQPSRGARGLCSANGRVVAVSRYGDFAVSQDRGQTWVRKGSLAAPLDVESRFGVIYTGTHWIVWACSTQMAVSADNGDTWSILTPTGNYVERVGYSPAGWLINDGSSHASRSLDNGVTWTRINGLSINSLASVQGRVYVAGGYPTALRSSADLVVWDTIPNPAFAESGPWRIWGGNNALLAHFTSPSYAVGLWQIGPVPAPSSEITTAWPVTVAPAPELRVTTGWRVAVAAAYQPAAAWPVQILDAARIGGLDGAASWAAAPDGAWRAVVWLGNEDISDRVTGAVSVQIAADEARIAEFSFLPVVALQPMALVGRPVRLAFSQPGGLNAQTMFRGVVDTPAVDVTTGVITCRCHDQAQEVFARMTRDQIDALVGGRWHAAVSRNPDDNYDYMRERIESVGASWALDVTQAPRVLSWSDAARTVTVRQSDVVDGIVAVELPSREQLRTRVTVRLQYRYTVLRARGISAQWSQPMSFFLPAVGMSGAKDAYTWPTVGMVEGAALNPPGWTLVAPLDIEHPRAGTVDVSTGGDPVLYRIAASVAPSLAVGFSGRYQTRWQQTVTEEYSLTVVWPTLEAQLGQVPEEIGATLESRFESSPWVADDSVAPQISVPAVGDVSQQWFAPGAGPTDRAHVLRTLLDRAWVRLWSASRSGRVRFELPCRPDLWLDTRCAFEGESVRAAGMIVALTHVLDQETGRATSEVELAVGMPGNTPAAHPDWTLPAAPYSPVAPGVEQLSAQIGTYVGGLSSSPPFDPESMIGLITNAEGPEVPGRNYYPVGLTIGWPSLTAADRDPRTLGVEGVITVSVPTDTLEIS